mgnify:CR=1 FL=1
MTCRGDSLQKGTTPNLQFSKFTDYDKQIVYIGVIDLSPNLALFLRNTHSVSAILATFVKNLKQIKKTSGSDCHSNTPLDKRVLKSLKRQLNRRTSPKIRFGTGCVIAGSLLTGNSGSILLLLPIKDSAAQFTEFTNHITQSNKLTSQQKPH